MSELDTSRDVEVPGIRGRAIATLAVVLAVFEFYVLYIQPVNPWVLASVHLALAFAIGIMSSPMSIPGRAVALGRIWDFAAIAVVFSCAALVSLQLDELVVRAGVAPTTPDLILGGALVVVILEMARRISGWGLAIVAFLALLYAYLGNHMPAVFWHRGYPIDRIISFVFSVDGIYGLPIAISATYAFLFIVFGAVLEQAGAGSFFYRISNAIAGRQRGGEAKTAIATSMLFGTVSGSSVANVVTTGTFTIPLMKRAKFPAAFAGAVEAVASTGGQMMPPIMGAVAFLMAEITSIPYWTIALSALIPISLYYVTLFMAVHLEAVKRGIAPTREEDIPRAAAVLREEGYFALPLLAIIFSLGVLQHSPIQAGLYGIVAAIVCALIKHKWMAKALARKLSNAIILAGQGAVAVAVACATAGIIVGVMSLTGLGNKFANLLVVLSGGSLVLTLILAMLVTIVLGMGMPTIAAYAVSAATVAPVLVSMGIEPIAAHFFVLYYACLSAITPPVALAAYAAAGIAEAPVSKVGWLAAKLGLTGFIIPFFFVVEPSLLLVGSASDTLLFLATSLFGVLTLSAALQGWAFAVLRWWQRALLLAGSLSLIYPENISSAVGFVVVVLVLTTNFMAGRKVEHGKRS